MTTKFNHIEYTFPFYRDANLKRTPQGSFYIFTLHSKEAMIKLGFSILTF